MGSAANVSQRIGTPANKIMIPARSSKQAVVPKSLPMKISPAKSAITATGVARVRN